MGSTRFCSGTLYFIFINYIDILCQPDNKIIVYADDTNLAVYTSNENDLLDENNLSYAELRSY